MRQRTKGTRTIDELMTMRVATKPLACTVPTLLAELATRYPDQEFLVCGERHFTYRAFERETFALAKGLHAMGIRAGDKVAILMSNQAEWLIADFAILTLGATMVSLNTWATQRELEYMLDHSCAVALVMVDEFAGTDYVANLSSLVGGGVLPDLKHIVRVDSSQRPLARSRTWSEVLALGEGASDEAVVAARDAVTADDVAYLLYTSGSTSTPKGVLIQHFPLVRNMWDIGERLRLQVGDRLWLAVSLFWGLGCENALFAAMTHAATIVLQKQFSASEAIRLIDIEQCTVIYATPNMVHAIAQDGTYTPGCLDTLRTGVTIGTPEQVTALARMGPGEICNVYGLTETYGNCAVTDARDSLELRSTSVGKPLPGFELMIVDPESGVELTANCVGEIRLRGFVTCGYYKDPEKNLAAFDDLGYFLTGDLGYLDEADNLFYRGRLKEMIKTGGINVAPTEVEEVLMAHPVVAQAFVVPLADVERDEIVAAVVVPHAGENVNVAALQAHCAQSLAAYKRPRRYCVVAPNELPLTSTGKVRKMAMAELFS
jgi:fatty-acyl-CoA synthase